MEITELVGSGFASAGLKVLLETSSVTSIQSSLESQSKKLRKLLKSTVPLPDFSLHLSLQQKAKGSIRKGVPQSLIRELAIRLWNLPTTSQVYSKIRAMQQETETYALECPTFSHHSHLEDIVPATLMSSEGFAALRRVLWAFSETSKFVWHCPVLPCIAALALLFLTEGETYLLLVALSKHSESGNANPNMNWQFVFTETQHQRMYAVISDFLRDKEKSLITTLESRGVNITEVVESLFTTFYLGRLHWIVLTRLFCCFLSEGSRILVRFTVGVMKRLKPQLVGLASTKDVLAAVTAGLSSLSTAEAAFKAGVGTHMPKVFPNWQARLTVPDCIPMQATFDHLQTIVESCILSQANFQRLWQEFPPRYKLMSLRLVYNSAEDGIHLPTLLRKSKDAGEYAGSILLFETLMGWKFGIFVDTWIRITSDFVGSADSLFFTIAPIESFSPVKTDSVYLLHISQTQIIVGEGPHGPAFSIDESLSRGYSSVSATFQNCVIENGSFQVKSIELFALTF